MFRTEKRAKIVGRGAGPRWVFGLPLCRFVSVSGAGFGVLPERA